MGVRVVKMSTFNIELNDFDCNDASSVRLSLHFQHYTKWCAVVVGFFFECVDKQYNRSRPV